MKTLCTTLFIFLLISCSSSRKAAKEDKKRLNHIQLLQDVRLSYPCDPDTIIQGITRYLPGDTVYSIEGSRIIIQRIERTDTMIVVDMAHVSLLRDSLAHMFYIDDLKNDEIKALQADKIKSNTKTARLQKGRDMWRNIAIPAISLLAIGIILKIKRII